jgi:hypothetical protein
MLASSSETTHVAGDDPREVGSSGGVVGRGFGVGIWSLIGGGV